MTPGQATHSVCHKPLCSGGFQGYLTISIGRDNTLYTLRTYMQQEEKFCKLILSLTTCSTQCTDIFCITFLDSSFLMIEKQLTFL